MENFWAILCVILVMTPWAALFIGISIDIIRSYEDERKLKKSNER